MALRAVLNADGFGELDEAVRGFYVESKDGNYVLDAEGVDELPQVRGLKSTLEKYRKVDTDAGRLKRRMDALAPWEAFADRDPEEVTAALAELDELRVKGGNGKGGEELKSVYENRIAAIAKKHDAEISTRDGFIERLLVDNRLDEHLDKVGEKGVLPETKKAVKAMLRAEHRFKVIREGDDYRAVVETEMGEQDVDTFVEAWGKSEDAKPFLPASGNNGSGAQNGRGTAGGRDNPWASGNLTEQGRIVRENPALANTLAIQAGKKPPVAATR